MAISPDVMFAILAMISYGLADFLAKKAVTKFGYLKALRFSLFLGTSLIFTYSLIFVKFPAITYNGIIFVLLAGMFGAIGWLMFYKGLQEGKLSIVSPIASSWGIITFLLALIILFEKLTVVKIISSLSIFAGIFFVSIVWKDFIVAAKKKLYAGAGKAMLSMIAFGVSAFFIKFIVGEVGPFYSIVFTRAVSIPLIFLYPIKAQRKIKFEGKYILLLFAVGLFDVLGYLSYNFGISIGLVSVVSAITSAVPLVAIILAYLFLKEKLAINQCIGVLLIIIGFIGLSLF